jgi:hypothetical protein
MWLTGRTVLLLMFPNVVVAILEDDIGIARTYIIMDGKSCGKIANLGSTSLCIYPLGKVYADSSEEMCWRFDEPIRWPDHDLHLIG